MFSPLSNLILAYSVSSAALTPLFITHSTWGRMSRILIQNLRSSWHSASGVVLDFQLVFSILEIAVFMWQSFILRRFFHVIRLFTTNYLLLFCWFVGKLWLFFTGFIVFDVVFYFFGLFFSIFICVAFFSVWDTQNTAGGASCRRLYSSVRLAIAVRAPKGNLFAK